MSAEIPEGLTWYALRVKPRAEGAAQAALTGHAPDPLRLARKRARRSARPTPIALPRLEPVEIREGLGRAVLCPIRLIERPRPAGKPPKRPRRAPLLTGWILCGFRGAPDWSEVLGCEHVTAVAGAAGQPQPIRETELAALLRADGRALPSVIEVAPGDAVRLCDGPLKGQRCKVESVSGAIARVLAPLFGGERPVAISLDKIERLA